MGNPHPFYRFRQGWSSGFYPDNQIVSDLLNEMQGSISGFLPSWVTPGVTLINELKTTIQNFVNNYNQSPYYGNFTVVVTTAPDPPFTDYYIYIRDVGLYALDNNQQLLVTGQYVTATKVISTASITSFTPGSYTGTFVPTLIEEELKVKEALNVAYMNGSAIFPITYKFDSTTNIATSGLARGSNWSLSNGEANRIPAPSVPYENQRTFELPELNGDDLYIISIMERIIQASLQDSDYTDSILATFNDFTAPDGWIFSLSHPGFTTYERVQFNFVNPDRRKFILVGRLDGQWLWQRFVSDFYNNPAYNFLTAYLESTQMPYEPNQAGRWLYNEDTFDFEFVEFVAGCYTSPEFYPMPAKPGDQFQFNIADGNLEGIQSANIGLFSEDGQFIQKIGVTSIPAYTCDCTPGSTCDVVVTHTISLADWDQYLSDLSIYNNDGPVSIFFQIRSGETIIENGGSSIGFPPSVFTTQDVLDIVGNVIGLSLIYFDGNYIFSYTVEGANCGDSFYIINRTYKGLEEPRPYTDVFIGDNFSCSTSNLGTQHYSSVTIPSKQGCYRMGLYNEPVSTCDLIFDVSIPNATAWIDDINSLWSLSYLSAGIWDGSNWISVSGLQITGTLTIANITTFFNGLPGVDCIYNDGTNSIDFVWNQTVDCDGSYNLRVVITDATYDIIDGVVQTDQQDCVCGQSYYLYSLSNIIKIDSTDCFSTIVEFWSDDNTIAEGFEYYGNWKQRIRVGINGGGEKPVIEESVYRQSNGVHRRPQNKQDLSIDLHTDFFDLDTQLAMTDATRHPYLVWNGQSVFVKGDLEVATIQDFTTETSFETLSQMKFQVLKQGFQPKNSSCLNC